MRPLSQVVAYLKELGEEENTIRFYDGKKVIARNAVLANASIARAIDLTILKRRWEFTLAQV